MKSVSFDKAPIWRVIASRHPPIDLFESVASAEEFDALYELEALFSPQYAESTLLPSLPRSEWVFGPGAGYIMAPFIYRTPTRFSNGSFGIYYAGLDELTAIKEVAFHRAAFMAATREGPMALEQLILRARIACDLVDIRAEQIAHPEWYSPSVSDYPDPQSLGLDLWQKGGDGLAFASVRHPGGECVGIFRPKVISGCRQSRPIHYLWDGRKIASWA
ncbi:MAG: RES family NAD+ phosphorylase [Geothrix sp.]|nr:RES family NAD+ phosphorylase [Geothrix sp.]